MNTLPRNLFDVLIASGVQVPDDLGSQTLDWIRQLSPEFDCFDTARNALFIIGGLKSNVRGSGIDIARFGFEIDPTQMVGEADMFMEYGEIAGSRLYPLGAADRDTMPLAIAEDGRAYMIAGSGFYQYPSYESLLIGITIGKMGELVEA